MLGPFRLRQVKLGHIKLSQVMGQNRSGPVIYKVKTGWGPGQVSQSCLAKLGTLGQLKSLQIKSEHVK